jgi:hypothetical protein
MAKKKTEADELKIEWRPVEDVKPYDRNPRKNDEAVEAVMRSIQSFGWKQPIVIDAEGTIVVGHTRYKAALQLGFKAVPVIVASDLDPESCRAYRIADNSTGAVAQWDFPLLKIEIDSLIDFDMSQYGNIEIPETPAQFLKDIEANEDADFVDDNDSPIDLGKDPNIMVRLSFPGSVWLGKRQEILEVVEKIKKRYMATSKVEE